jgi:hypothetical protein
MGHVWERLDTHTTLQNETPEARDYLGHLGVGGKKKLKWTAKK